MSPTEPIDPVRNSALGQLLYQEPVKKSPSELPSALEEELIRIEDVSAQPKVLPVQQTAHAPMRKPELHEYQGKEIDVYV